MLFLMGATVWAATPRISFVAESGAANEDVGSIPIRLRLSEAATGTVSVACAIVGGSADGSDLSLGGSSASFAPGSLEATLTVAISNDAETESQETAVFVLHDASGAALTYPSTYTLTLLDDDGPPALLQVQFPNSEIVVSEDDPSVRLEVAMSDPPYLLEATVDYVLAGDLATPGEDFYAPLTGTLLFPTNETETSQFIEVLIEDDERAESNETFTVTLLNPNNVVLGNATELTCTLRDNDVVRTSLDPPAATSEEFHPGFVVDVSLDRPADYPVEVEFDVGGTATDGVDFRSPPFRTVTFEPGVTNETLAFEVLDDEEVEDGEEVLVFLTSVDQGVLDEPANHNHLIIDDDDQPLRLEFSAEPPPSSSAAAAAGTTTPPSDYAVWPGSSSIGVIESAGEAVFEIVLSDTSSVPVQLDYLVVPIEAASDVDYRPRDPGNSLVFFPGERTNSVAFEIIDDTLVEADESFRLVVTNVVNARMDEAQFTCWILDDDEEQAMNEFLYEVTQPAVESGRVLRVLGSKTDTMTLRGLALDSEGNRYITDHGPSGDEGEGSIIMWPKDHESIIRLVTGLTRPDDIEISRDETKLLYVTSDGQTHRYVFGVLVRLVNLPPGYAAVVYGLAREGPVTATYLPEGYYHIPSTLEVPGRVGVLDIVVEHGTETGTVTRTFYNVLISAPGLGRPVGERIVNLHL